ncbi:MAG: hypothetical protein WCL57_10590, partial [Chloroflexota bacterium]
DWGFVEGKWIYVVAEQFDYSFMRQNTSRTVVFIHDHSIVILFHRSQPVICMLTEVPTTIAADYLEHALSPRRRIQFHPPRRWRV